MFDPFAAIQSALRVHPEPLSFPEGLEDAEPIDLAEARNALAQVATVATELRKIIDQELAGQIGNGLRYGDTILRPAGGVAKVVDADAFYACVNQGLAKYETRDTLIRALFSPHSVKLGGLPILASILDVPADVLKESLIDYDPPTSAIHSIPIAKAPKYLQKLEDGQISGRKNSE